MGLRLALSRRWVQALFSGSTFGILMTLFAGFEDGRWFRAVVKGVLAGSFFGVFMSASMTRLNRRMQDGLQDLPPDNVRAILLASSRGPAPTDPHLLEAARVMVQRRWNEAIRNRRRGTVIFLFALGLDAYLAITETRWWWLAATVFLAFLVLIWVTPSLLQRRLRTLGADGKR